MKMRRKVLASMLFAFLPWLAMAQSTDDLYYIPKKEKKTEVSQKVGVVPKEVSNKTVNEMPANTAIVVKDVKGNVRNVDEYNRRYTSRDNTFTYENDTLYIEEKPYGERGEWVNGFQGSDMDYEYAMRLVRFRNPRYAIPVSSPLYWDVVYGAFPSWDWNVYDDGMYAYVFPTYTNRLWWDWRWSSGFYGPGWGFSFSWHSPWYSSRYSPWYYGGWYSPWYAGHWGGYWGGYWGAGWYHHHHHHYPYYGWSRPVHYNYNTRKAEYGYSGRNISYRNTQSGVGNNSYSRIVNTRDNNGRTGGRVVRGSENTNSSVRVGTPNTRTSTSRVYTRPSMTNNRESNYTRPSSTRVNSNRNYNVNNGTYNSNRNNYNSNRSNVTTTTRNYGGSSYRSTTTSGSSSRNYGTSGGSKSGGGVRRR